MDRTVITIEPTAIEIKQTVNGITTTKMTTLEALQEVLTKDRKMETPLLPGQWGTQKYAQNHDREFFLITTPPHTREVVYSFHEDGLNEDRKYKIPLPGLAWFLFFTKQPGSERRNYLHGYAYAIKNPLLSLQDQLYRFPFSNVDNHWMCWGDYPKPSVNSSKGVQTVPDLFLNLKFNNHLDHEKYQPFIQKRNGQDIKLFKTSHLFEYLHELQEAAEKEGKDAEFKYDCLKTQHRLDEALRQWTGHYLSR